MRTRWDAGASAREKLQFRLLCLEPSDADYKRVLARMRGAGLRVQTQRVRTRAECLQALRQDWDIVLAGSNGSGASCQEVVNLCRLATQPTPLILLVDDASEAMAAAAMREGASDYLLKTNLTRLVPAMLQAMDASAALKAQRQTAEDLARSQQRLRELAHHLRGTGDFTHGFLLDPQAGKDGRAHHRRNLATHDLTHQCHHFVVEDFAVLNGALQGFLRGDRFHRLAVLWKRADLRRDLNCKGWCAACRPGREDPRRRAVVPVAPKGYQARSALMRRSCAHHGASAHAEGPARSRVATVCRRRVSAQMPALAGHCQSAGSRYAPLIFSNVRWR